MRLSEAIEIVTEEYKEHHYFSTDIIGQAERLLIEAGKDYARLRPYVLPPRCQLLPGETKE